MAKAKSSACVTVATGGVGESGAAIIQIHQVSGKTSKMMVLRNVESSLCPNTGAVSLLLVNGAIKASGDITAVGSTIQAEASPGEWAVAITHTFPLFNDIVCVRLGELLLHLDECDLVTTATAVAKKPTPIPCDKVKTRKWYAWNDKMPPPPDAFHVIGQVQVPNPGVLVFLAPKVPQGINPKILLMDLFLYQLPGHWPQVQSWKEARYDKVLANSEYEAVEIFCGKKGIAKIKVEDVH